MTKQTGAVLTTSQRMHALDSTRAKMTVISISLGHTEFLLCVMTKRAVNTWKSATKYAR